MSKKTEAPDTDGSIFDLFSDLDVEPPVLAQESTPKPEIKPPNPISTKLSHKQRQILANQRPKQTKPVPEDLTVIVTKGTARLPEPDEPPEPLPTRSKTATGPEMLPCGHWNWYSPTALLESQIKGICCPGYKKHVPYWPAVTGTTPVIPTGHRRTKQNMLHGFCADSKTGKYIGGPDNNCKLTVTDPNKRCLGHQP